jgi:preprotein translocase subunit SecB
MSTAVAPETMVLLPSGIAITGISLRELHYEEVEPHAQDERAPPIGQTLFDIFTAVDVKPPDLVQVSLKVNVRTNPKEKPIKLRVIVSAVFKRAAGITNAQLAEFLRTRSQHVIFPYVREVVSSITGRGVTGALYINPVVLEPFMTQQEMIDAISKLDESAADERPAQASAG